MTKKKPDDGIADQKVIVGSATEFLVGMGLGLALAVFLFVLRSGTADKEINDIREWVKNKIPQLLEM